MQDDYVAEYDSTSSDDTDVDQPLAALGPHGGGTVKVALSNGSKISSAGMCAEVAISPATMDTGGSAPELDECPAQKIKSRQESSRSRPLTVQTSDVSPRSISPALSPPHSPLRKSSFKRYDSDPGPDEIRAPKASPTKTKLRPTKTKLRRFDSDPGPDYLQVATQDQNELGKRNPEKLPRTLSRELHRRCATPNVPTLEPRSARAFRRRKFFCRAADLFQVELCQQVEAQAVQEELDADAGVFSSCIIFQCL